MSLPCLGPAIGWKWLLRYFFRNVVGWLFFGFFLVFFFLWVLFFLFFYGYRLVEVGRREREREREREGERERGRERWKRVMEWRSASLFLSFLSFFLSFLSFVRSVCVRLCARPCACSRGGCCLSLRRACVESCSFFSFLFFI